MKKRKNPYGIVWLPLIAMGVAGGIGVTAGTAAGAYYIISKEIDRIQDYDGVSKILKAAIDQLRNNKTSAADVSGRPSLMIAAPTNARQALLQASWYIMQAASLMEGVPREKLLSAAEKFWDDSESASKTIVPPDSPEIQEPLQAAIILLEPYGELVARQVTMLYAHTSAVRIAEQTDFEKENFDPAKYVTDALKETGKEVFLPTAIAWGLLTGKRPFGMSALKWNLIRFSIYGGVGLFGIGYLMTVGKPYIELLKKGTQD